MRVRFGSFTLVAVTILTAALTGCAGMRVVPVPAPAASLSSNVTTVQSGQTATLTWQTQNATTVTLNGNPVSATGSMQVNPLTTTTYTLVATGPTGTSPAQSASTITVTGPPAPVANLSTSAPTVLAGQSATLTWTTQNATAVTLDGTAVPASGTQTVTPSQDTTYTLVANGCQRHHARAIDRHCQHRAAPYRNVGSESNQHRGRRYWHADLVYAECNHCYSRRRARRSQREPDH